MEIDKQNTDLKKLALIKAACNLIAIKGFEGLRIREIAANVGINAATLYYYYPTKEALIDDLVSYVFNQMRIFEEEAPGTPREQLHAHLTRLYRKMLDEPGIFAVFIEIQLRMERTDNHETFKSFTNAWHVKLEKLIQTGIKQGYWPNYLEADHAANTIIMLMQGAFLTVSSNPRRVENSIAQLERWLIGR
ncbi:TetR/AcrR family transcriptional regulator [Leptolinea tardivitalis]|uniref:HTH tetR-type domain-containing protein n=1 Tax=Leptolinea tardivitalis TaxID=229920 RepID=A0A0P6WR70_9CHLR|nr:TetR/AcrR family transcriptional regulator [Leptolinea tardivitalis]KPL72575.1 hypothetical protein ADM99_05515 [Leptolinea tardivitalis]GAP21120.1 transcriptional regulator, TetR family [Leptolinea tardivitalis]